MNIAWRIPTTCPPLTLQYDRNYQCKRIDVLDTVLMCVIDRKYHHRQMDLKDREMISQIDMRDGRLQRGFPPNYPQWTTCEVGPLYRASLILYNESQISRSYRPSQSFSHWLLLSQLITRYHWGMVSVVDFLVDSSQSLMDFSLMDFSLMDFSLVNF